MKTALRFNFAREIPGLRHAITTRAGGVSEGDFGGLNLAYHVGDEAERVSRNRKGLADALGYHAADLVAAQQVHGTQIQVITAAMRGRGALDWESALPETDALIVAEARVPVMILVADCAPIILADVKQRVLAVIHAGWRGAVAGIAFETVMRLWSEFGTEPQDIRVGIGPCLCPKHFEIGLEVVEQVRRLDAQTSTRGQRRFRRKLSGNPDCIPGIFLKNGRSFLDLHTLIAKQLFEAGMAGYNITFKPQCPQCKNEQFFSHRGQNGQAGRFGLVAWWE